MGAEAPAPDTNMSSGMALSETDGMPSLSGMSPSDAAAFLQSNRKVGLWQALKCCGQPQWGHLRP